MEKEEIIRELENYVATTNEHSYSNFALGIVEIDGKSFSRQELRDTLDTLDGWGDRIINNNVKLEVEQWGNPDVETVEIDFYFLNK